jgi:hypothetical protein
LAETLSDLCIVDSLAAGDFTQSFPDALLECRALHVQRQSQPHRRMFDEADDLSD